MPRIDVYSDLDTAELNTVGLAMFAIWSEFAMGQRKLGGRMLREPTGTYQSSLRYEVYGKRHVAVISDTSIAPHAKFIESGHRAFDMLAYLRPSGRYPIRRSGFTADAGGRQFNVNLSTGRRARGRGSGLVRSGRFVPSVTGIVRAPRNRAELGGRLNTSKRGPAWTVPAMPAYSPTRLIMGLFAQRVARMGGTIGYTSS